MAFLPFKCPHCELEKAALEMISARSISSSKLGIALVCPNPSCKMPSAAVLESHDQIALAAAAQGSRPNLLVDNKVKVLAFFPPPKVSEAPDFVPPNVARIFIQAVTAERQKAYDIAAMGYRKSLDIALKEFDESVKGDFYKRINTLAERHDLTPAMKDWAHAVRLLGNEGAHDPDEPTEAEVADLHLFTVSILEYLFTLPARVTARREAAEGRG